MFFFFVDLSEAIDVYNAWIDACEEANKNQPIVT
jgi:transcription elongation factor Elf1